MGNTFQGNPFANHPFFQGNTFNSPFSPPFFQGNPFNDPFFQSNPFNDPFFKRDFRFDQYDFPPRYQRKLPPANIDDSQEEVI